MLKLKIIKEETLQNEKILID